MIIKEKKLKRQLKLTDGILRILDTKEGFDMIFETSEGDHFIVESFGSRTDIEKAFSAVVKLNELE